MPEKSVEADAVVGHEVSHSRIGFVYAKALFTCCQQALPLAGGNAQQGIELFHLFGCYAKAVFVVEGAEGLFHKAAGIAAIEEQAASLGKAELHHNFQLRSFGSVKGDLVGGVHGLKIGLILTQAKGTQDGVARFSAAALPYPGNGS